MTHISVKRSVALDLLRRGLITQAEAAKLTGESQPVISYLARGLDCKAARSNQIKSLWQKEIEQHGT
jgi:predicted transcriptional regulator